MSDMQAMVVFFGFFQVLFNLVLTLLNVKLFTEFAKQRMQESRKERESDEIPNLHEG